MDNISDIIRSDMQEVGSIRRAAEILNLFTQGYEEVSTTEIVQKLKINRSTVMRLIYSLVSNGILRQTSKRGKYCLGVQIMNLARAFLLNIDLEVVCQPYLNELRSMTEETITLDVREEDQRVCISIVEGNKPVRMGAKVKGERATLHAGADSKLLLAFLPDEEIDKIIKVNGLPRYTVNTITNKKKMKKEIDNIRENDFSISKEERWEYAYCISAPIRNYTGMVIAALSIIGVIMSLNSEREKELINLVKEKATDISNQLGYWDKMTKKTVYKAN